MPIPFLSALADRDDRLHGLRLGADDYITKPFSLDVFISRLRKRLAGEPTLRIDNVHGVGFIFRQELA